MDAPLEKPPFAWQPITPRGVAAFARASWGRVLLAQFLCALAAAGTHPLDAFVDDTVHVVSLQRSGNDPGFAH